MAEPLPEQVKIQSASIPQVSVILPVYNGEKHLHKAITSILEQTFEDFELLVIDDGSTDNSAQILSDFAQQDARIRVFSRKNHGLIASLNFALKKARARFIARMDADDISAPERIEHQLRFFAEHPDIGVLGTGYEYIDNHGKRLGRRKTLASHENIVASFFFGNPIAHPSVMFNALNLPTQWRYDADYPGAEDLALWLMLTSDTKFANLPETLLQYRISGHSESDIKHHLQRQSACKAIYQNSYLNGIKTGAKICAATYNRSGGFTEYPKFLWGCIRLNWSNVHADYVPVWALLKRTLAAQLSFFKKPLRQVPLLKEKSIE